MSGENKAYVLADGEGEAIWFANALVLFKANSQVTNGRLAVMDQHVPAGYSVPRHVHHAEDEAWYLLEGEVTFYCGNDCFTAGRGAWVFLPREIPHTFKAGPEGARLLTLSTPAGFGDFVQAAGEPAAQRAIPPQGPLDLDKLMQVSAQYGIEIVGPPPD